MKIAIVSTSQIPSTTANSIQVMKVCQAYVQVGHEVQLFIPGHEKYSWDQIGSQYGISEQFPIRWITEKRIFHRYDFSIKAVIAAKDWRADFVHTWTPQAALLAGWFNLPYLMELHELPSGKFGPRLFRLLFNQKAKKRFLVITNALKNLYSSKFNIQQNSGEWVIAPNGVELEKYKNLPAPSQLRVKLDLPDKYSAVYTGHFYEGRGMVILEELARAFPDIQFFWVGGRQKELDFWKAKIREEKLENILLTGFVKNDLIPLYQGAGEILLMPYERFIAGSSGGNSVDVCSPMKMREYMAAGRAILSSDLPVLHEMLNDKNAIFCSPDDPQDWVQKMDLLIKNPGMARSISTQAKSDVAAFSWKKRAENAIKGFLDEK